MLREPLELFSIDLPETYMGVVLEKLALRKGKMVKMVNHGSGRVRLDFHVPTRGLIGVRTELLTDTRGTAVMNSLLEGWVEWQGEVMRRQTGVLVADRLGDTTAYALSNLEDRGRAVPGPGNGGLRGHDRRERTPGRTTSTSTSRKPKKLTNMRASTSEEAVRLDPAPTAQPGAGPGVHRRRRAGRGDARGHPPPQAHPAREPAHQVEEEDQLRGGSVGLSAVASPGSGYVTEVVIASDPWGRAGGRGPDEDAAVLRSWRARRRGGRRATRGSGNALDFGDRTLREFVGRLF